LSSSSVALEDARLLQRVRRGDPEGVEQLWDGAKDDLWSVCVAMTPDGDRALDLLRDLYDGLWSETRAWRVDAAICCLVAAYAWRRLQAVLQLEPLAGIDRGVSSTLQVPGADAIAARLAAIPGSTRLVYLLDLFFACPADELARLTALQEDALRDARADATFRMLGAR
jgi:DNA-directed RNA polymerase specialized sigma24 family protein